MITPTAPWINHNKRTIRAPLNPMDRSTIVSIFPKNIDEKKPTIQPGRFQISPGSFEKPAILIVGSSSWWKELDDDQPLLEIPNSSIQIADSVVRDYSNGLLACDMDSLKPGLFYVMGCKNNKDGTPSIEMTKIWIQVEYQAELEKARIYQRNWYAELIKIGDVLWAQSNGNPLSISDDMRLAAQELNLKEKPWLLDFTTMTMVNCSFCGTMVHPGFPICASCHHVVDHVMYAKMQPVKVETK